VTIFSAPNYCNEFDNDGAMLKIREDLSYNFALKLAKHIDIKLDDLMKAVTI